MRSSSPLSVEADDLPVLREWIESGTPGSAAARRARIVLLARQGLGPSAIAGELRCSKQTVITWRERYRAGGLAGLRDAPRSGRPVTVDAAAVVLRTLEPPGPGTARWSTRTLAAELGISNVAVAGIWRAWGIAPGAAGRVRLAAEPAFEAGVAGVLGVHLDPLVLMIALLVAGAGPGGGATVPVRERRDPGPRLAVLDTGHPDGAHSGTAHSGTAHSGTAHPDGGHPGPGTSGDHLGPATFLDRLGDAMGGGRVALLVEEGGGPVRRWAQARPGVGLHVVAPAVSRRLVRVACLLAGATRDGGASVAELDGELDGHRAGTPLSWVRAAGPERT